MPTYRFVCQMHDDFGSLGWRLESQPDFDPLGGMAVAHDILEHFPDGDESPADEFQALGCSLILRNEDYYGNKNNRYSPAANVASDMPDIIQHVIYQNMFLGEAQPVKPLDDEHEETIREFIKEAMVLASSEFDSDDWGAAKDVVRKSEGWIRLGMKRGLRRYKNSLNNARSMFMEIETEADKLLKHAMEGDVLVVKIKSEFGFKTASCHIKEMEYA